VLAGSAQRAKSACRQIFPTPSPSLSLLSGTFNKPPFHQSRNPFLAILRKYNPWLAYIEGLIIVWVCRGNGGNQPVAPAGRQAWEAPAASAGTRTWWAGTRCPGHFDELRFPPGSDSGEVVRPHDHRNSARNNWCEQSQQYVNDTN